MFLKVVKYHKDKESNPYQQVVQTPTIKSDKRKLVTSFWLLQCIHIIFFFLGFFSKISISFYVLLIKMLFKIYFSTKKL